MLIYSPIKIENDCRKCTVLDISHWLLNKHFLLCSRFNIKLLLLFPKILCMKLWLVSYDLPLCTWKFWFHVNTNRYCKWKCEGLKSGTIKFYSLQTNIEQKEVNKWLWHFGIFQGTTRTISAFCVQLSLKF